MGELVNRKFRIAVGVSGGGRSLQNLLRQQSSQPYEIVLVFSSSPNAGANELAIANKLPLLVLDFSSSNKDAAKEKLYRTLEDHKIDLVVLAGFLKLLPISKDWEHKIINIHPALLPRFGGKGMHGRYVHQAVIRAGERFSGASVHFVNAHYDEGGIIAQVRVPVDSNETADSLANKVFTAECQLLPVVIGAMARGTLPQGSIAQLNSRGGLD